MTKEELLQIGSEKVRESADLLAIYIQLYKEQFGSEPDCISCSFSTDWYKFANPNIITNPMKKTFQIRDRHKIHTYRKDKQAHRMYGYNMTEQFAIDYLTEGTEEEIEERKKDFKILPNLEKKEDESDEVVEVSETETEEVSKAESTETEGTEEEIEGTLKELKKLYPQFKDAKTRKEIVELIKNE